MGGQQSLFAIEDKPSPENVDQIIADLDARISGQSGGAAPRPNDPDRPIGSLRERRIGGAGLDVLEQATPPAEHPLFRLENVLITPHVAFLSQQSVHELEVRTAQATVDVLTGRMPEFLVNPGVLPHARTTLTDR